jgi:carboxypeptidase PM20D1
MAHQDVVPVPEDTLSSWKPPPFGGKVSDNKIWGRCAVDIKIGVMDIFEATEALLKKGFSPKRSVCLAFGHDEEVGGEQGAAKITAYLWGENL